MMRYYRGMKLEYCKLVQKNSGVTKLITEKGGETVVPNEDILTTLNRLGEERWEAISGLTVIRAELLTC